MGTEQKVAVITGASQGIGAALVKAYRDRNYRVVATARSIKPSNDDDVLAVAGDIADPTTAERVISEGVARFGRIDTLVNNAGIFIAKPFTQYTEEDFAAILRRQPRRLLPHHPARHRRNGEAGQRPCGADHDQPGRPRESRRAVGAGIADQGRSERRDQIAGDRIRQARHPRERGRARHHQVADASRSKRTRQLGALHPVGPHGRDLRHRQRDAVSRSAPAS